LTIKRWLLVISLGMLLHALAVIPACAPGMPDADRNAAARPQMPAGKKPDQTGYIKGIYVSHAALGDAGFVQHVRDLLESTELNAVVLDFKSDRGQLTFPTQVDMAHEIGADREVMIQDVTGFMRWFTDRGIYTIARIPVFKDNMLAQAHPEWAVKNAGTGEVWRDPEGMGWADPNYPQVWDYNIALAVEAARLGFNEVQFDYVRFPTDGNVGAARFASENIAENRNAAITGLLRQARDALAPQHVKLAADVFGYAAWVDGDLGIGQDIEALAPYLDVLSPMLYPSTFNAGLPGEADQYRDAIAYPYDIVYKSTRHTVQRAQAVNPKIDVRPWLQDFQDYAFDRRTYTPGEIRQQMNGAREGGGRGWLLWDPAANYTRDALVSAQPAYPSNLAGNVLVVAYRDISTEKSPGVRTPDQLRTDLERFLTGGYYPVNLRDMAIGKLNMVPAGKRPVVLTFDDATAGQFRLRSDGTLDPDTAVGILMAFHVAHPADWPLKATFFVRCEESGAEAFGTPELAGAKLKLLNDWGMEIGIQPAGQDMAGTSDAEDARLAIGRCLWQISTWVPGYEATPLSLPEGWRAADANAVQSVPYDGNEYDVKAAVSSGGGFAPSPLTPLFDAYHIPRVPGTELASWLQIANRLNMYYVSAGEALQGSP